MRGFFVLIPEGCLRIAQGFNAGWSIQEARSPEGTTAGCHSSAVPCGTTSYRLRDPNVETLGHYRTSLRDGPIRFHSKRVSIATGGRFGHNSKRLKDASVLVAVLWCLVLLALVVVSVLHTARIDLLVVKNYGDRIQAHYLAVAGIEKAKAVLYQEAQQRSRSGRNYSGALSDSPEQFRDVRLGRGQFRVFHRGRPDEGGGVLYGVSDEESRLNINNASADELGKLEGMTPDIVAAILDWRDEDNAVSPGGAEAEYYLSLQPPYLPRNGPVPTLRELLMVREITPDLLLARDRHQNGLLDSTGEAPDETVSDSLDLGWAGLLTADSRVDNVNAAGADRVNIQSADEAALTGVKGISSDSAKAIIAYRGQNRLNSVADLLDVVAASNQNQQGNPARATPGQNVQNRNRRTQNSTPSGPKVIDENLLMDIADDLTTDSGADATGLIDINSASLEVLSCLPGLTRELAQAIISFRQSNGFLPNTAWLLRVPGLNRDIFKQLAPRVTARSETFRILSEGKVTSTGAHQRVQEIVHIGLRTVTTLSYREDDL